MTDGNSSDTPCTVKTSQGFSVQYKGRYLYSKYNPTATILRTVLQLRLQPDTLVLCCSPCLCYGIAELSDRLPKGCFLFGCEADRNLYAFTLEQIKSLPATVGKHFCLLRPEELEMLPEMLHRCDGITADGVRLPAAGTFRRAVRIDFSGGAAFYADFYAELYTATADSIGRFWKNRLTLVQFGRRYSRNFFLNLAASADSSPFFSVNKPLLVLGAGESLEPIIMELRALPPSSRKIFFIIAVDAALYALQEGAIIPDAVICEEAQSVIASAFIGGKQMCRYAFSALSSCPRAASAAAEKCCFYTTLFEDRRFILSLKEKGLLPPIIPPLGSVGLSAVYLAARIRADERTPIFIAGLDFSYSAGKTHAKGTFHDRRKRMSVNRIAYFENYAAAFGPDSRKMSGKNGKEVISTTVLSGYAELFTAYFANGMSNCFDIGECGLALGLPTKALADAFGDTRDAYAENAGRSSIPERAALHAYFEGEVAALEKLKGIFTGRISIPKESADETAVALLYQREYLFLHFPDGIQPNTDIQFLNRVRVEIDYFLNIFGACLNILGKKTTTSRGSA